METILIKGCDLTVLNEKEIVNIHGGGLVSDAFWYVVGYLAGQKKRMEDTPTGALYPGMY